MQRWHLMIQTTIIPSSLVAALLLMMVQFLGAVGSPVMNWIWPFFPCTWYPIKNIHELLQEGYTMQNNPSILYLYLYIYVHIGKHMIHMNAYICIMYVCLYVYMHMHMCMHMHMHMYMHMHMHMYMHMHMHMHMYMYMYVYVCVCNVM